MAKPPVGSIIWQDLTVPNSSEVRSFYESVIGWKGQIHEEGSKDFNMLRPSDDECVAGVCSAEGANADLPPAWLLYISVESVEQSIAHAKAQGGELVAGPKSMGDSSYAVLRDPAGAVFGVMD